LLSKYFAAVIDVQHEEGRRDTLGLSGHQTAIFEQTMVKSATYHFRNVSMHPVLHPQHIHWKFRTHQPLEKALVIVALETDWAEDSGGQLFGISDEDESLAAVHEGNEAGKFDCLSGLINDHCIELKLR
jgi:hypothetical protein